MRFWLLRFGLAASGLAVACISPPKAPNPNAAGRTEELLRSYPGSNELSGFVGMVPEHCLKSSLDTDLCQWSAGNRLPGWRPMATAIGTRDRVNLVCELPASGAPRAPASCSIHPRRSNRYSWSVPTGRKTKARRPLDESASQARERNRSTANAWIEQARTLAELSRLMGAIPESCTLQSDGAEQACLWRTDDQTFGHGTLAAWLEVSKSKKIRFHCRLPFDGSPRAPASCFAEVGA
jgi:hypothetical protein